MIIKLIFDRFQCVGENLFNINHNYTSFQKIICTYIKATFKCHIRNCILLFNKGYKKKIEMPKFKFIKQKTI